MRRALRAAALLAAAIGLAPQVLAEPPAVGEPAPGFELTDQNGEIRSLEDYRDGWVALYFYPKDDTPDCTTEACEFRDDIFEYRRMGCQVLGISLDDVASHKAFAAKYGLPFPLLADTEGNTAKSYGVKSRMFGMMSVARRQTFLIDPDGKIARHYEDVDPGTHSAELLADLAVLTQKNLP
ncbi:MAG: peroxiredoxin [Pseudomonadota bacterium]